MGWAYRRIRKQIDTWHFARANSPSTAIDRRRANRDQPLSTRSLNQVRQLRNRLKLTVPGAATRLMKAEQVTLQQDTNLREFELILKQLRPDAIFSLTPFHRQEELILRAAETQKLPLCTAILSFDNITTRGWIPVVFDHYLLWNQHNESELRRVYPKAISKKAVIVGPAQFDFYWDQNYLWSENEWRKNLSLPEGRPVILFGGGPKTIVPHEPQFLAQLDQAVGDGEIPGKPIILFRRHPVDSLERWLPVLRRARNIVCDDPWLTGKTPMYFNFRRVDIERLVSTLSYADVHVNSSSTMTVDGAAFDRPQVGPAYDDRPGLRYDRSSRELYLREHFLPITQSGGLDIAYSRMEMIAAVKAALLNPSARSEGRQHLVREVCTFADGKCTDRVAAELQSFLSVQKAC